MTIDKSKMFDPEGDLIIRNNREGWGGTSLNNEGQGGICTISNGSGSWMGGGEDISSGDKVTARRPIFKAPGSGAIKLQPGSGA